jgi:DNA topoisomerase-1
MKLMIIESPGKIPKLKAILGDGWQIAASVGHVRDLPKKEMGIEPPDFKPQYELIERGVAIIAKLKTLARQADAVYLATDPDREGESISWHLQQCLRLDNPLRVTFNEITPAAVKAALNNPRTIDVKRVAAQEARRVLDRLVGYMVSPELSRQTGERLSAGRVQSPAVYLVVERERQIQKFKVTHHFGALLIFAYAKNQGEPAQDFAQIEYSAEWLTRPNFVTADNPYFMGRAFATAVAEVKTAVVRSFGQTEAKRSPPAPFTTSTLQQAASVTIGLDPKATMEAAQKLYEQGHITYHRTDNPNVSDDSLSDIYAVAVKMGLDMAERPRKFKAPEGAQEGHPAITPTHWDVEEAGETGDQRALYAMIRLRAIACQLADARYAVRTARLEAVEPIDGKAVEFEAKGRTLVYRGWLKLLDGDQTEEAANDNEPTNPIPDLAPGQILSVAHGKLLEKKTQPPSRYTQASLIKKLESDGVGRPATYAAIMENIISREYVATVKKNLVPTDTGYLVVDSLAGKFQFIELGYTREVERDLDRVAQGEASYKTIIQGVHGQLKSEIGALQMSVTPKHPCPSCGKPLNRIKGKTGYFWGCASFPDCNTTLPDNEGEPGLPKPPMALSAYLCKQCNRALVHRTKAGQGGYDFWGCSGYKDGCKKTYPNLNGKPHYDATKTVNTP